MPQWQKRRLHVLERANWRCAICGATDKEIHVHHLEYNSGKMPWDYPDENFLVVCRPCHEERIHKEKALYRELPELKNYQVSRYEHIDDYRCFQPLRCYCEGLFFFEDPSERFLEMVSVELRRRLDEFFKNYGWEGDGEIRCIFIPPCFVSSGYSSCETVFHVKQSNNGTSFLALPPGFQLELAEDLYA